MAKKTIIGEDGKTYEMKEKKPLYKKKRFIIPVVLILLAIIGSMMGGGDNQKAQAPTQTAQKETPAKESSTEPAREPASDVETPEEPKVSKEYENALKKAESYSENMHMSKQGIYDQLISEHGENFPAEAAQYAVDNLQADYKKNALEKAKSYQDGMSMSKESIREQLTSEYGEKFTQEEAEYAVENLE